MQQQPVKEAATGLDNNGRQSMDDSITQLLLALDSHVPHRGYSP